jgi:hypothetical protein
VPVAVLETLAAAATLMAAITGICGKCSFKSSSV